MLKESPAVRDARLGAVAAAIEQGSDGIYYVRNLHPLGPYPPKLTERLEHWARIAPERTYLAERDAEGAWRHVSYGEALETVRALASGLLQRGLSADRPLLILSGNDIEHALLGLAALYAGIPYAPIAPAYALVSKDFQKLRHVYDLLTPGLVFASNGTAFANAIDAVVAKDIEIIVTTSPIEGRACTLFSQLAATPVSPQLQAAHAAIGPDTIAKILFTSGSTGVPKGVINTQLMLCANIQMATEHFAFMKDEPPVVLDWSPWNHTAGGNHNFNLVLYNGGTLYIDDGKPTPAGLAATVRNLKEVAPTWYFNVPKGFDALIPHLRADEQLRSNLYSRLRMFWYAGAGMSPHVWSALDEIAVETCGERIVILSGLGSTETAPFAMAADMTMVGAGKVGVPARGVELKLVPSGGKYEARVRGALITPGYWRQPELTAKAFDEEGFYRIGDALRFVSEGDVSQGFIFDGRIAEDFKLSTGTWVSVGNLRAAVIDGFAPYVQDAVIAGLDRDYIAALAFPDMAVLRKLSGETDAPPAEVLQHPAVRSKLQQMLDALRKTSTGSSTCVERIMFMETPPSMDKGEMTDKGSINQRAVLDLRQALVDDLYSDTPSDAVLIARR
ncbi:feruloyl-CoA synthase [Roseiarcaceae bacterium H3SJ34-1]|uniref:feruloyl-CoA synthase n=1 Tax=Terripilifer ovatus TaxID=3032367 RepID=UPI003AB925E2|nr:feruloyl-CoA synthase [Roseiarcaceae bacterium H3SJ34-1]